MGRHRITHIRKSSSNGTHEHITHAGDPPAWFWTKEQIIASIDAGTDSFYISVNGKQSEVGVVRPEGKAAYIRSYADGYWNDNLLALPSY